MKRNQQDKPIRHRPHFVFVQGDPHDPISGADLILMAGAILVILLIMMVAMNKGFEIRYKEIRADQEQMGKEINDLQYQVDKIQFAVEEWHGID